MRLLILICALCLSAASYAADCSLNSPEDFNRFFARFARDKSFSSSRKLYPLQVHWSNYGIDRHGNQINRQIRARVTKEEDAAQPALNAYMKKNGLASQLLELRAHYAAVLIFNPQTHWQMSYIFRRQGQCWFMTEVQNESP